MHLAMPVPGFWFLLFYEAGFGLEPIIRLFMFWRVVFHNPLEFQQLAQPGRATRLHRVGYGFDPCIV